MLCCFRILCVCVFLHCAVSSVCVCVCVRMYVSCVNHVFHDLFLCFSSVSPLYLFSCVCLCLESSAWPVFPISRWHWFMWIGTNSFNKSRIGTSILIQLCSINLELCRFLSECYIIALYINKCNQSTQHLMLSELD